MSGVPINAEQGLDPSVVCCGNCATFVRDKELMMAEEDLLGEDRMVPTEFDCCVRYPKPIVKRPEEWCGEFKNKR